MSEDAQLYVLPQPENTGYGDAAQLYWDAGWRGILPLPPHKKDPPPPGRTGHDGQDPSYPDILQYCELYADGNLALRMPDTIIGIDVDAHSGKTGAATIAEAERRWGALPLGPRSSSRLENGDQTSGIRFFRVPAGTRLSGQIQFDELAIGHIEVIQNHHRYAVAWPSIHDKTGQTYWWYNGQWQHIGIPNIEDFPPLPDRWIEALQVTYSTATANLGEAEAGELINRCLTDGPIMGRVATKLGAAITELQNPHGSRHEAMIANVLTMLRYGKDGETGVKPALIAYQQAFITALSAPGQRHAGQPDAAAAEFRRAIFNPNAAKELTAPSHDDWIRQIVAETVQELQAETPKPQPEPQPEPAPDPVPDPVPAAGPRNATISASYRSQAQQDLERIEQGFWDSRESLRLIFDSAVARMAPPWGVLAVCAARAICLVPPKIVLPPIIGGQASLNQFFGLASPSGGGKGISGAVGTELVPGIINERKLGSPEGLLKPFRDDPKDPDARLEAVWFNAAEIDGFKGLGNRNKTGGTDLLALLRECWDGASVGFGWLDNVFIEKHTYRMTLTVGIQPLRAGWLLADNGGTPQRFMWFLTKDERANRANYKPHTEFWATPLNLPRPGEFMYPRTLAIPAEAEKMIIEAQEAKNFGLMDALDGHALQAREKFAFTLAVLDGRADMTLEDWELSGIAAQVSTYTRDWCKEGALAGAYGEAEERGTLRGVENFAADLEKDQRAVEQVQRVTRWILKKLGEAGDAGITQTDLGRAANSKDRKVFSKALEKTAEDGLIRCESVNGGVRWWLR